MLHISTKNHNRMRYSSWDQSETEFEEDMILDLRNKKHNHIMYAYSDREYDRRFFVILGHFLLFYHTTDHKN